MGAVVRLRFRDEPVTLDKRRLARLAALEGESIDDLLCRALEEISIGCRQLGEGDGLTTRARMTAARRIETAARRLGLSALWRCCRAIRRSLAAGDRTAERALRARALRLVGALFAALEDTEGSLPLH